MAKKTSSKTKTTKKGTASRPVPGGKTVLVEFEDGIAWVYFNRPAKKNCMNPELNSEMLEVLEALEIDNRCKVLVLSGKGDSFSAGMDLQEYFRDTEHLPAVESQRVRQIAYRWQRNVLMYFQKPTIAMVNGWCFGGGLSPLVACDLAVAADEAKLGISEINWGIIPAGNVLRVVAAKMNQSDGLLYAMTGRLFDGKQAAKMGLVNESVPLKRLKAHTRALAQELMTKNLTVMAQIKTAYKHVREMPWDMGEDYLLAKAAQTRFIDRNSGYSKGLKQFLDDKTFRPGLGAYDPEK
jgi:trans-feruloyl-CoA hydratase/vanillin synthase